MADGDFVEYLVAHGAYAEAARAAAGRGELARAIALYERVWRFADAWPLALALGDRALAVRLALDANLPAQAAEIAEATPPEGLLAVAEAFAARGRTFEAARTAERAGAWTRAAAWYRRAGAPLDEARAETRAGALREAGLIYERLIGQGSPGDEATTARLALGRLLARLGRADEAVRHLQIAARVPALRTAAWRALCGPLLALGLPGAAAEIAARLHAADESLPRAPGELALLEEAAAETGRDGGDGGDVGRRYQLRRLIGAGAVGRVYEAFDSLLGAPVALKLLAVGGGGGGDPERQAYLRYAREAEAAGRLRHPNIVALADAQPASGLFVFELMTGGTLADRLAIHGPLPLVGARRLALDLLAALGAAHERGIVHRDVKPANIFYDAAGNAKLGDFGSAHLADFGQTQTGGFFGTVAYMSPEQITGAPIGYSADLYALGATLVEALTGKPPFFGPDLGRPAPGRASPAPVRAQAGAFAAARRGADARAGEGAQRTFRLGDRDGGGRRRLAHRGDGDGDGEGDGDDRDRVARRGPGGGRGGEVREHADGRAGALAHQRRATGPAPRSAHRAGGAGRGARLADRQRGAARAARGRRRRGTPDPAPAPPRRRSARDLVRGRRGRAAAARGAHPRRARRRRRSPRPSAGGARARLRPDGRRPGVAGRARSPQLVKSCVTKRGRVPVTSGPNTTPTPIRRARGSSRLARCPGLPRNPLSASSGL